MNIVLPMKPHQLVWRPLLVGKDGKTIDDGGLRMSLHKIFQEFGPIASLMSFFTLVLQIILLLGMVHASYAGNKRYLKGALLNILFLAAINGSMWFVFREISTDFIGPFFLCFFQWGTFRLVLFLLNRFDRKDKAARKRLDQDLRKYITQLTLPDSEVEA